jgi:Ser/Thr protein kinase RdoA (MazF antagonist)
LSHRRSNYILIVGVALRGHPSVDSHAGVATEGHPYNYCMHLLQNRPTFDVEAAAKIAAQHFGIHGTAQPLPSERDQNFLLTSDSGEKFVLKISNALEQPAFIEAQNAVLQHLATRVTFCQRLVTSSSGKEIVTVTDEKGVTHLVRMVNFLPGAPLAQVQPHTPELLEDLGRKLGELRHALADFDHPAVHRDFHWDLANGKKIIDEYAEFITDPDLRKLVLRVRWQINPELERSVIHGDLNDYNVLVDPETMTVTGLIDFGDMVYSCTIGELAIAIAYVLLDKPNSMEAASDVFHGYASEYGLVREEVRELWPLVFLRLGMSVCIAAYQLQQQPDNEYLRISQQSIETLLRESVGKVDEPDAGKAI